MENKIDLNEILKQYGFEKIRKPTFKKDEVDLDRFSHIRRIHIVHYLFFSSELKIFSLAIKHDHPKKTTTGKFQEWTMVTIPKIIETEEDVVTILKIM